jgi:hypothetical protein
MRLQRLLAAAALSAGILILGSGAALAQTTQQSPPLPPAVVAAMQAGIADEQHAYAVYGAVIKQFGSVRPFTNIQRSEAQHIAAWKTLFDRYGVAVPKAPAVEVPKFASLQDACKAAVDAEIANRNLYDKMFATLKDYPDMLKVATQLRTVSDQNHLPAFQRCAR